MNIQRSELAFQVAKSSRISMPPAQQASKDPAVLGTQAVLQDQAMAQKRIGAGFEPLGMMFPEKTERTEQQEFEARAEYRSDIVLFRDAELQSRVAYFQPNTLSLLESEAQQKTKARMQATAKPQIGFVPAMGGLVGELQDLLSKHAPAQLRAALKISAARHPHTEQLLTEMSNRNLASLNNLFGLHAIFQAHGAVVMENVSQVLIQFLEQNKNSLEAGEIMSNALMDLALPSDIDQKNRGTCGAAALQMKLAIERPEQYVKILTHLAREQKVTMPSGKVLKPNNSWRGDVSDQRNLSAKIMQNAIVNLALDAYPWPAAQFNSATPDKTPSSLNTIELTYASEEIFGSQEYDTQLASSADGERLYQHLEDDLSRGRTVSVSFEGHSVLAVGLDKTQAEPRIIMNSWGKQYSMGATDFKKHVRTLRTFDDAGEDLHILSQGKKMILGDQ